MDHPKLEEWKTVWRERRSVTMVYILLRISVVLVMLAQIFNGNFENVFLCVLTLILFMMPSVLEKKLDITLPDTLQVIILLFIYRRRDHGRAAKRIISIFRTGIRCCTRTNGFLCAAVRVLAARHPEPPQRGTVPPVAPVPGHRGVLLLHDRRRACGSFSSVRWTSCSTLDMQKDTVVNTIGSIMLDPTGGNTSTVLKNITDVIVVQADGTQTALGLGGYLDIGLLDTMEDLFVNFIGALTFSIIGYFYVCSRGENKFAKRFIPVANNSTRPKDAPSETPEKNKIE